MLGQVGEHLVGGADGDALERVDAMTEQAHRTRDGPGKRGHLLRDEPHVEGHQRPQDPLHDSRQGLAGAGGHVGVDEAAPFGLLEHLVEIAAGGRRRVAGEQAVELALEPGREVAGGAAPSDLLVDLGGQAGEVDRRGLGAHVSCWNRWPSALSVASRSTPTVVSRRATPMSRPGALTSISACCSQWSYWSPPRLCNPTVSR